MAVSKSALHPRSLNLSEVVSDTYIICGCIEVPFASSGTKSGSLSESSESCSCDGGGGCVGCISKQIVVRGKGTSVATPPRLDHELVIFQIYFPLS